MAYLHQEGIRQRQPKFPNESPPGRVNGQLRTTYPGNTPSNDPDPKRIKSSINLIPNQSRANGDHILLNVVFDLGELLQADVNAGGRRESRVRLMATTLNL